MPAELCPPTVAGTHVAVSGWRTEATGTGVEVRVVNRGTDRVLLRPAGGTGARPSRSVIESGTGLTVAELNGQDTPSPPLLATYPQMPLPPAPGEAAVVTLLPIVDPCATDAEAATLHVEGPQGSRPVEGQDDVRTRLSAAAALLCARRP